MLVPAWRKWTKSPLSFMDGLGGGVVFQGHVSESNWGCHSTFLSATSHLDTSDLVQSEHKRPSLMRQGLAGRTLRGIPPRPAAHPSIRCQTPASGKGSEFTLLQEVRSLPPSKVTLSWYIMSLSQKTVAPGMEDGLL